MGVHARARSKPSILLQSPGAAGLSATRMSDRWTTRHWLVSQRPFRSSDSFSSFSALWKSHPLVYIKYMWKCFFSFTVKQVAPWNHPGSSLAAVRNRSSWRVETRRSDFLFHTVELPKCSVVSAVAAALSDDLMLTKMLRLLRLLQLLLHASFVIFAAPFYNQTLDGILSSSTEVWSLSEQ